MVEIHWDSDHFEAHKGDFFITLEELIEVVRDFLGGLPTDQRKGWFREVIHPDRVFGLSGRTETTEGTEVLWAIWPGREKPSRMAKIQRVPVAGLVVIGAWDVNVPDTFHLMTGYPGGAVSPVELHSPWLWKPRNVQELERALQFWQKHALIAPADAVPVANSQDIEDALQQGDLENLRKLLS